jgi:NAD kinase
MTSTAGSPTPSARRVARAAVITQASRVRSAPARSAAGGRAGARCRARPLLREAEKHGLEGSDAAASADLAVVLGGDGTVLRALARFLGTGVPVIGVNFGRVGFLSSMGRRELEAGSGASSRRVRGRRAADARARAPDGRTVAVNDVVVTSAGSGA